MKRIVTTVLACGLVCHATLANKHLPEMPSAAKIERDGQNVGEVQKLSLKKVEELTLYVIELKGEIEKLKK